MKIIETFLSIQGEGIHAGIPTFFIRTSGCNLRCSYCDTKYSYKGGKDLSIQQIIKEVESKCNNFDLICLTGGEPLLNREVKKLIEELLKLKFKIDIETNGSILINNFPNSSKILYSLDIKCPSSGMDKKNKYQNLDIISKKDQVKFIIKNDEDYAFSKKIIEKYKLLKRTNVIFTPVGGIKADNLVRYILRDKLNVRIGLQIHKVIWNSFKTELNLVK